MNKPETGKRPFSGEERRQRIIALLKESTRPLSGTALGQIFSVSRQVIVQDIALLRTQYPEIISTHRGYLINQPTRVRRIFKVSHDRHAIEQELNLIVDAGGCVLDVFVRHPIYGKISAPLNIASRRDVELFMEKAMVEDTRPLTEITDGIHYHTVEALDGERIALIRDKLLEAEILIDEEPVTDDISE